MTCNVKKIETQKGCQSIKDVVKCPNLS